MYLGGVGRDANDDKRIELSEFTAGYSGVTQHGFVGLEGIESKKQAKDVFKTIDGNSGGMLLLDEWCSYLKEKEAKADTSIGKLLAAEMPAEETQKRKLAKEETIAKLQQKAAHAKSNNFGLAVGKGKAGASKDYHNFAACFEPMCAETPEGEKLRDEGFLAADPNGNGLCSLAELETFVLLTLLSKYPNSGKGKEFKAPGKDLWAR